jgi:hypothetical protein
VLIRNIVTGSFVALCASAVLAAQAPTTPAQTPPVQPAAPRPGTQQPALTQQATATTLTGCVYREQDVPGRAPNVAERVGVLEDYILAVDMGAQTQAGRAGGSTTGTVGTSGITAPRMYKLEFASDKQLGAMVGKRVEVTGRIDAEANDAPTAAGTPTSTTDKVLGRDRVDLAEFEVASIKETAGTCPAKPAQ